MCSITVCLSFVFCILAFLCGGSVCLCSICRVWFVSHSCLFVEVLVFLSLFESCPAAVYNTGNVKKKLPAIYKIKEGKIACVFLCSWGGYRLKEMCCESELVPPIKSIHRIRPVVLLRQ